jgi:hypothetical protein
LLVSGTRIATSCGYGGSLSTRNGFATAVALLPDRARELQDGRRVGRREVEVVVRSRSGETSRGDPAREVAAVRVAAHLVAGAEDAQRVLSLQDLLDEVGHDVAHRERTLPLGIVLPPRARVSPIPTQLNGRQIVYGSPYCSLAPRAKYSHASFWNP